MIHNLAGFYKLLKSASVQADSNSKVEILDCSVFCPNSPSILKLKFYLRHLSKRRTLLLFVIQEGNLKRYPTPYPDELKNMVKTVQTIVHRLKDEESTEDIAKESKRESQAISVKDVGVKVRDNILF